MTIPPTGADGTTTTLSALLNPSALFDNPLFAGGLGLAGLGTAAALARKGLIVAAHGLKRRLLINVEISRQDPSYPWILAWLSQPREAQGFIASRLTRIHNHSVATSQIATGEQGGSGSSHASFLLQPGYGRHVIRVAPGVYVQVNREKQSTANTVNGVPHETVTLTTLWAHRHIFEKVFTEAHALDAQAAEGKTPVHVVQNMDWAKLGEPRRKRPLGSVVLDEGIAEGIVSDVKDFLARREWYSDRGIPYRRGYLLYGPPGSGKSSFIFALAGELDYGLATINLSERGMTDDKLAMLLTRLPRQCILLLEDADSAFVNRRQRDSDGYSGASVTFSGLLNALDGVAAGEERIAFLTTNHIDRLDPALIRPGRVDLMVRIGEATRHQAAYMWDRFYGDVDLDHKGREKFLARLSALGLLGEPGEGGAPRRATSTAAIQGLFLFYKTDMEGAIAAADALIPKHFEPASDVPEGAVKTPA